MARHSLIPLVVSAMMLATPAGAQSPLSFTKLWTHGHSGQVAEIPAFDPKTNTIWVVGVVGVDVLDAADGSLVEHIDVTPYGFVNSVAIHNGLAALAVEAAGDRRNPGSVLFYDTPTRLLSAGVHQVTVGALPDMLTFTHDGSKLLVANEATPNAVADTAYTPPDPPGSVTIIDMATRTVAATAGFAGVPQSGANLRTNTGMDFEPEYIAVDHDGRRAFVTIQEGNAIAVLDLRSTRLPRSSALAPRISASRATRSIRKTTTVRCRSSRRRRKDCTCRMALRPIDGAAIPTW